MNHHSRESMKKWLRESLMQLRYSVSSDDIMIESMQDVLGEIQGNKYRQLGHFRNEVSGMFDDFSE